MPEKKNDGDPFDRMVKYCTYQERCHTEVRSKLISLGVYGNELENMILKLIENGFLNEERFARIYAGGKFRQLHWGRNKIIQQLKFRNISPYCIREAMKEIDEESYLRVLRKEIAKRRPAPTADRKINFKTAQYLISRGFEPELVWQELQLEE
jgi:regulatory protein